MAELRSECRALLQHVMEGPSQTNLTKVIYQLASLEHSGKVSLAGSRSTHRVIGTFLSIDSGSLSANFVHRACGDEMVPLLQAQFLPAQPPEPSVLRKSPKAAFIRWLSHMLFLNKLTAAGGLECSDWMTPPYCQGLEVSPI